MLRMLGKVEDIMDSASRFVEIYLDGRRGKPAAAEMYTKDETFSEEAS